MKYLPFAMKSRSHAKVSVRSHAKVSVEQQQGGINRHAAALTPQDWLMVGACFNPSGLAVWWGLALTPQVWLYGGGLL